MWLPSPSCQHRYTSRPRNFVRKSISPRSGSLTSTPSSAMSLRSAFISCATGSDGRRRYAATRRCRSSSRGRTLGSSASAWLRVYVGICSRRVSPRRDAMATYVLLTKVTAAGIKTLQSNPRRIKEVNKDVEALGARVVAQYATLGRYDFVNIVEAKDNETIARLSVALGARGTVQIETLTAIPVETFIRGLSTKAKGRGAA